MRKYIRWVQLREYSGQTGVIFVTMGSTGSTSGSQDRVCL
jgi:hypothetical protein